MLKEENDILFIQAEVNWATARTHKITELDHEKKRKSTVKCGIL